MRKLQRVATAMSENMDEEISDNKFENQNSQGDDGNAENTVPPPTVTPALGNNYELTQLIKVPGKYSEHYKCVNLELNDEHLAKWLANPLWNRLANPQQRKEN